MSKEIDIFALGELPPKPVRAGPWHDEDGSIAIDQLVAEPSFAPKAWQSEAPRDLFGGHKPPVQESADLARVLALPRRPKLEPGTPAAEAVVEWAMREFALPPRDRCRCAEIDPQRVAKGGSACISRLKFVQAWALREIRDHNGLLGIITVGGGKCFERSTEFLDYSTGRRRQIDEPGALRVASYNRALMPAASQGLTPREATAFPSDVKECVRVTLADGCAANPSTDHPYLTHRGWVHAADLRPREDFVAVAVEMPEPENPTIASDEEVSLIGMLLADGGCNNATMGFTNMTPAVIAEFERAASALGLGVTEVRSMSRARQFNVTGAGPERSSNGRHGNGFRAKWDLYGLARNKRMHASLWGLPRRQVALLLNRFWACDGHIQRTRGVELTLASEKLVDDVRFLCSRLGVRTRKSFKPSSYVREGTTGAERVEFDAWRITAYGEAALKFLDEVGPVLGKEDKCAVLRASLESTARNANTDVVPVGYDEMREILGELGIPRTPIMRGYGVTQGQFLSRAAFVRFCAETNYTGRYAHLATTDVAWERVDSIETIGSHVVYDLNVPETHNFVANGAIVHNTIIGLLAALAFRQCRVAVLLVPPSLIHQLKREYLLLQQHYRVPWLVVHGTEPWTCEVPDAPILRILPYSWLSRPEATEWFEATRPDVVIADEADKLANPNSATTSRVLRYFQTHADTTRFACWSGSITDDHLSDYAHLAALALREGSPLPIDPIVVDDWGRAIDPSDWPAPPGALLELCDARDGSEDAAEHVRDGYYRRLVETPGVVSSTGAAIATPLRLSERRAPEIPNVPKADPRAPADLYPDGQWPGLASCLKMVRGQKLRPDGEELVDPLEWTRCAQQLSCGFFYRWRFPRGESPELIKEWREARKEWRRELRKRLSNRMPHLDSEKLGELAAMRGWGDKPEVEGLPTWRAECWPRWREIRDAVYHETETVLLDDFLARDAAEWGREHRGVIWYETRAFGEWVARLSGLPLHTGGPAAARKIAKETGRHSIIASISSHGRGRDGLQRVFCDQLISMPPSSSSRWEQLLGRLSREGQPADEVLGDVYAHTKELRRAIAQALRRARYVEGTVGAEQKILASMSLELQAGDASEEEMIGREWLEWRGVGEGEGVW